ncbi:hypothetical protein [Pelagerythrobacter aerophilus]|uniref:Uncharacterized protein n=1 Tax=Pelagerythrobacter aerophilus TaxID=2306995 RepID=A0A418NJS2_9SPHN|nr:hypothetical protein [Pelagerythrobacter aerophilus]RIV79543.1 hypothetical protein D2V04_06115 [Pelagerythrobacter aerophilus]
MTAIPIRHIANDARINTRTVTFRAWRVPHGSLHPAIPLDIGAPGDITEALARAIDGTGLQHKDALLIHARDEARRAGVLRSYGIKQRSQAVWRKCEATGERRSVRPLYADELFALPIFDFEPERPFDALRDDAVGLDRTIVEIF